MLISQYESRTGKEKVIVIANEEKGRRGPEKDSLFCGGSYHGSGQKTAKKDHVVLCRTPPPSWIYEEPSSP